MIIEDFCMYCGACAGVCNVDAIQVQELKIVVNDEKCVKCGLCVDICPVHALTLE
ncbi:4Fe-4S binding protein [Methanosphaera sp.]